MNQLFLNLDCDNAFDDFIISNENFLVHKTLENFFSNSDFKKLHPNLLIIGQKSCGKSHILFEFSKKNHIIFLKNKDLQKINFLENEIYLIENIEEIEDENMLFHTINSAIEAKSFLIFTARNDRKFKLKDLNSRIKNFYKINFKTLSEEFAKILFAKKFEQNQIKIDQESLSFLSKKAKNFEEIEIIFQKIKIFLLENNFKQSIIFNKIKSMF